jgi:trehalose-phosphatase
VSTTAESVTQVEILLARVASAPARVLFVDYDGTLAPLVAERNLAWPYAGMVELLANVRRQGTRVVIVSGRVASDVRRLLGVLPAFEIWGSHGCERLLPNGDYRLGDHVTEFENAVASAYEELVYQGLAGRVESKPSGLAVHWRGLSQEHQCEVAAVAERILGRLTDLHASLVNFDGGMELRIDGYDKGSVVRTVMSESPAGAVAAFLGDDLTDEDGFRAVEPFGAGVLVRSQYRQTDAEIWLRPPHELAAFLKEWYEATGGQQ